MKFSGYNKYRNVKTVIDGQKFDSQKEARRYTELKLKERAGIIRNLRTQVKYELLPSVPGLFRAKSYIADFVYIEDGNEVVEDSKGMRTNAYKLKKHLLFINHKILIKET